MPEEQEQDRPVMVGLDLGNYHGTLTVKAESGQHYIGLEDWDDWSWIPISESLYALLVQELSDSSDNPPPS